MTVRSSTLRSPLPISLARISLAGIALLLVIFIAVLASVQVGYAGRVYPGVEAMGVEIGGMTVNDAKTALERRWEAYSQMPLTLTWEDRTWRIAPAALGLSADVAATAERAYEVGRQGNIFEQVGEQFASLGAGGRVEVVAALDESRAQAELEKIGAEVKRSPQNAGLAVASDGKITVEPSKAGVALDVPKALTALRSTLFAFDAAAVTLPGVEVPVTLSDAELGRARDRAMTLVSQPITLTTSDQSFTLGGRDLTALIAVKDDGGRAVVTLDEEALTKRLETIAGEIKRPVANAKLSLKGREVEIVPGADGQELDVESSRTMILARLGDSTTVPLVVRKIEGVPGEKFVAAKARLDGILASPVAFKFEDKTWSLSPDDLAEMLVLPDVETDGQPRVTVDADGFAAFAKAVAKQVDREPQDARFKLEGNSLKVVADARDGVKLDVDKTRASLEEHLADPGPAVAVRVALTPPAVTAAAAGQIVVRDLIMESSTPTSGSIAAKMFNMELATSRLNGTAVPPGGTFSFNKALGPATLATGFKLGYGIAVNAEGEMQTVPSEAGGICQVASTLFHSVYWAGYPIVERNWHMYWIPKYGQPPRGMKGLDATVDDAYGVDFQFKNNTDDWLIVESSAAGGYVRFALRGVKPDWTVKSGNPVITNVVPAKREMVYEYDPTLGPGRSLMVEGAEDGFDVSIARTVSRGDTILDQWVAKAHYRPSRNVTLVGTKPTPTPSGTPGTQTPAAGTPAPQTTPTPGQAPQTTPTTAPPPAGTPAPKPSG